MIFGKDFTFYLPRFTWMEIPLVFYLEMLRNRYLSYLISGRNWVLMVGCRQKIPGFIMLKSWVPKWLTWLGLNRKKSLLPHPLLLIFTPWWALFISLVAERQRF